MTREFEEPETSRHSEPAVLSRGLGILLIALSFLRWPATALVVAPASGLADHRWLLIPVIQACAEVIFWIGVCLVGRAALQGLRARASSGWRIGATVARSIRNSRPAS